MSAPSKSWESMGHRPVSNGYVDDLSYPPRPGGVAAPGMVAPPPLPPRRRTPFASYGATTPSVYSNYGNYGAFSSPFGGSGMFGSSPYGMPFSPYRSSFDRYGHGGEDGQSPFQSVESVVRAFSSLSMLMESTYQSMFMSFRAVMGVAENMERLRRVVLDLFGGIAVVKSFVWFFKKILYIMGLIKNNPSREKLWEAAASEVMSAAAKAPQSTGRTWPLVAFFGLMLGGPYILYKLMNQQDGAQEWDPRQDGVKCIALYDFDTNQRGELPFRRGEVLVRQRGSQGGWSMAAKNTGQTGYVPTDRLKPISEIKQQMATKSSGRYFPSNQADVQNLQRAARLPNPGGASIPAQGGQGWNFNGEVVDEEDPLPVPTVPIPVPSPNDEIQNEPGVPFSAPK
ncbi:hypothetical protein GE061_008589 [Apolygus lucorum]|uniref:Peroxisomal membrane protein PEX13 n=1 Tax=Apolygus lucorum TaxID=248454 RepID=A0A6A4IH02_APOLU|nr:hypothetical protein GE061_008589 [Apolygus lucorum]